MGFLETMKNAEIGKQVQQEMGLASAYNTGKQQSLDDMATWLNDLAKIQTQRQNTIRGLGYTGQHPDYISKDMVDTLSYEVPDIPKGYTNGMQDGLAGMSAIDREIQSNNEYLPVPPQG